MSQQEFVQKWKHEFRGMILDSALRNSSGAERSMELKQLELKIDRHLAQMYADAQQKSGTK